MEQTMNRPVLRAVEPREPSPWLAVGSVAAALLARAEARRTEPLAHAAAWAAE